MIREVIVVEGENDVKHLKSFMDVDAISVSGLGITKETIEMIKALNEKRGVIVFCDPDHPGEKIRAKINEAIPGLKNAFINKKDARTSKKVGVEHATKEKILEALDNLVTYKENECTISESDMVELGLVGDKRLRDKVSAYYHLGEPNVKTMRKRLNMLEVKKEEVQKTICKISSLPQK